MSDISFSSQLCPPAHGLPGALIVVEGPDGSGKTGLTARLSEHVRGLGRDTSATRLPTALVRDTSLFDAFVRQRREDLVDFEALQLLQAADRIQHTEKFIRPRLSAGGVVICDRYFHSTLVTMLAVRGAIYPWMSFILRRLVNPDLTLILDCSSATHRKRLHARGNPQDHPHGEHGFGKLRHAYGRMSELPCTFRLDTECSSPERVFETAVERLATLRLT